MASVSKYSKCASSREDVHCALSMCPLQCTIVHVPFLGASPPNPGGVDQLHVCPTPMGILNEVPRLFSIQPPQSIFGWAPDILIQMAGEEIVQP